MNLEIKEQPYNDKLEADILGMLILEPKRLRELKDKVKVSAFFNSIHIEIYTAMLYLFNKNIDVSYYTIMDRLKIVDGDGKLDYLLDLANSVASTVSFDNKVDILNDLYYKRTLQQEGKFLLTTNLESISSDDLVKRLKDKIEGMGVVSNIEYDKFEDYIDEWVKYQEDETVIESFKTGYEKLDDTVLMLPTNLIIVGARPSCGKSAFATNLVKNFCKQGKHPLFVSLEMSKREFLNRLVANMSEVPARKLKRKEHKDPIEWAKIMEAKEQISKWKFNFYDKGGMYISQLVGLCRYLKQKGELDVLIIDYIQLLQSHNYKNQRTQQVGYISHQLKMLAQELEIPVIALAQLSRANVVNGGKPREPQLSDLRESGDLENDANVVMMLHTDDVNQEFVNKRFIKLFIRKNRDGKLGAINFAFYGDYLKFSEQVWDDNLKRYVDAKPKLNGGGIIGDL